MKEEAEITLSFSKLMIEKKQIGNDLLLVVEGGEKPHIGCTVLSIPRPSLRNPEEYSCTSSVLNVTGHKDEEICRYLAEKAAKKYHCTVVCTGGFHVDHIRPEQIEEIMRKIEKIEL